MKADSIMMTSFESGKRIVDTGLGKILHYLIIVLPESALSRKTFFDMQAVAKKLNLNLNSANNLSLLP